MFTHNFAQDEVTHQRLRVGSKKHALSLPEGSVRSCPEAPRRKGRSHFYTRSVCGIREYGEMATCLRACASKRASARRREAAPAEAGNAAGLSAVALAKAGGFFQQTHTGKTDSAQWPRRENRLEARIRGSGREKTGTNAPGKIRSLIGV